MSPAKRFQHQIRGANSRVAGEGEFLLDGEDVDFAGVFFGRAGVSRVVIAGKGVQEDGLREVEFTGDALLGGLGEMGASGGGDEDYGEGVAEEGGGGEDVEGCEVEGGGRILGGHVGLVRSRQIW